MKKKNNKKENTQFEYGKILPQAVDVEEIILGSLLIEDKAINKIANFLEAKMFYKEANQLIYGAILELDSKGKTIDSITVRQILINNGVIEIIGGAYYLMQLTDRISGSANIQAYARIIQQKYIGRELINISSQTINTSFDETQDVIETLQAAEKQISALIENTITPEEEENKDNNDFPLEVLPAFIQNFISEVNKSEKFSNDFMATAFLAAYAGIVGRNLQVKYTPTWITAPIFWFIIVGAPGSKKSHPVKLMLRPLKEIDKAQREIYDKEFSEYEQNKALDKTERGEDEAVHKPIDKQLIIKNTTTEALFYAHKSNPDGLLYYRDEIEAWVRSMDQYKGGKGDDMANWLSLFDGDDLNINRVTKERLVLNDTNVNLIGTTQPGRLNNIPSDNGLIHRLLFTREDKEINGLQFESNVDDAMLQEYNNLMHSIHDYYSNSEDIKYYTLTQEAKDISMQIDTYLVNEQLKSDTTPIIKEYCEKLKTYIPRFEVLLADANTMFTNGSFGAQIEAKAANDTFLLIKYFLENAKYLFIDQNKMQEAKNIAGNYKLATNKEKAIEMINKGVKVSQIATELNISRVMIYKYKKYAKLSKN